MKVTVFKKIGKTHDGRTFDKFVANLEKKDGTKQYVNVRFKDCDVPKEFPIIIEVVRESANLSKRVTTSEKGDSYTNYTLWVTQYKESSEKYVDHSLDDYQ